jgi:hypothetical protein
MFPVERRARIEGQTDRLQAKYRTRSALRKARELPQVRLAEVLGTRYALVKQIEKRRDHLLPTLRGNVETMGGHLNDRGCPRQPMVSLESLSSISAHRQNRGLPTHKEQARWVTG